MHPDSIPSPAFVLVERWLVEHLCPSSTVVEGATRLPSLTVSELLAAVRTVLAVRPALAQAAHQLSVFDQFRLTLELVRASGLAPDSRPDLAQPAAVMATRRTILCLTRHPGRRRVGH
jgi:hypothetical protein